MTKKKAASEKSKRPAAVSFEVLKESPENTQKKEESPPKKPEFYLKNVNLGKQKKRLLNILERDIRKLLKISETEKLSKEDSAAVCTYLKLISEIEKKEVGDLGKLSEEELERIANGK